MLRTPGEEHQGVRVGTQQQVGSGLVPKAGDGGGVKGNAILKGPGELRRHNRNIFLPAKHVAEGQVDKGDLLLLNILDDLLLGILHSCSRFL